MQFVNSTKILNIPYICTHLYNNRKMKNKKLLIWGLVLTFATLMSIPFLVPHTGFISLIALVPLLCMERIAGQLGLRHIWVYHYSAFVLWNALTTFWVCNATIGGGIFAILANAMQMSVIFAVFRFSKKKFHGILPYILLMTLWITWERAYFDAEISWPWLVLGNAFATSIRSVQWYEYTGTLGGSLWIWMSNLSVFGLMVALSDGRWQSFNKKARVCALTGTAALFTVPFALSALIWHNTEYDSKEELDIVIAQPNIDPYHKFEYLSQTQQNDIITRQITACMGQMAADRPVLIMTPETFTNDVTLRNGRIISGTADRFRELAGQYGNCTVLLGASSHEFFDTKPSHTARPFDGKWYESHNSALSISDKKTEIFHKNKLVVGVEYMPYPAFFSKVDNMLGGVIGRCVGQGDITDFSVTDRRNGAVYPYGCAICYESIYGEYYTGYIRKGARFMTIITNDAWWGDTPGYRQHLSYASLRAIETRRDIARCANTGISSFINIRGEITRTSDWWKKETLTGTVRMNDKMTFFVKAGDITGRLCSFLSGLLVLALLVQWIRTRKQVSF